MRSSKNQSKEKQFGIQSSAKLMEMEEGGAVKSLGRVEPKAVYHMRYGGEIRTELD